MSISKLRFVCLTAIATLAVGVSSVQAAYTGFAIRNSPTINTIGANTEFIIESAGQKGGYGSDDINGAKIGQITNLGITRFDDTTRFTAGSGPAVGPYLNIWVTDGVNFAVLANEPSNPDFQPLFIDNGNGTKSYSLDFADLADKRVQVYETANGGYNSTNTWVHNLVNINGPLTFGDLANLTIGAPSPSYISGGNGIGGGAPREDGTNIAYGVNWIFGDTLANYVTGDDGYIVGNGVAQAVPEPATVALAGVAGLGLLATARRRRNA